MSGIPAERLAKEIRELLPQVVDEVLFLVAVQEALIAGELETLLHDARESIHNDSSHKSSYTIDAGVVDPIYD